MKPKPIDSMWTDEQWEAIAVRDTNVLVAAGAGSGKTAVLSERVLELVSEGVDVTDLIVLTFTNAAASEMKARIRKKLIEAGQTNQLILASALKIDNSFITTFDSYCLYLVKKYHYLLNINKQVAIIDNASITQYKQKLMHEIISGLVARGDQAVIDLLTTYTATSSNEMEVHLINWYDKTQQNMAGFVQVDERQLFAEFSKIIFDTLDEIKQLVNQINQLASETNLPEKIEERLAQVLVSDNYDMLSQSLDVALEGRLWVMPRTNFDGKEEAKKLNDKLKKQLKSLHAMVAISESQHLQLLTSSRNHQHTIKRIFEYFKAGLNRYKRDFNLFEFIDINLMAIEILEQNEDVRLELKHSVYEIMIDEYQDTNDIQERFVDLIADNNVYMVGDIKQSIYGFRNANPSLFGTKYGNYMNGNGGRLITLTNNFRSRQNLLAEVNDYFGLVMSKQYGGIDYDVHQVMKYGNKTYDKLADTNTNEIISYRKDEIDIDPSDYEIIQICLDIKSKLGTTMVVDGKATRTVVLSDFAIIAATREKFRRIVEIGQYFGLSIKADVQEKFATSSEIAVIQSLFNIVNIAKNGSDDDDKLIYSIIQVARSYLFDYSDSQIDTAIDNLNRVKSTEVNKRLYALSQGQLAEFGNKLNPIIEMIDLKSNGTIYSQLTEQFKIVDNLVRVDNPLARQLRLAKLNDLINDFDRQAKSLNDVCMYLNNIERNENLDIEFDAIPDQVTDSVTVITTHKSKGLEYNICYFPFLSKKFNAMDIYSRFGYSFAQGIIMPGQISGDNLRNTIAKTIADRTAKQELISEKIRLLYVALTRAKDRNILILDRSNIDDDKIKEVNSAGSLNDLIGIGYSALKQYEVSNHKLTEDVIEASKYNRFKSGSKVQNTVTKAIEYAELEVEASEFTKRRASGHIISIIDPKTASNIEAGNNLHEQLEFTDLADIDNQIEESLGLKRTALINLKNSKLIKGAIEFYPEFQFNDEIDGSLLNGIIDLLVETEEKMIVIDYKLNAIDKPEYIDQVTTYVDYIQSITEKQVEGYLLSLISGKVKRVK